MPAALSESAPEGGPVQSRATAERAQPCLQQVEAANTCRQPSDNVAFGPRYQKNLKILENRHPRHTRAMLPQHQRSARRLERTRGGEDSLTGLAA
jgi:hypothetical protein